jgi:hypothetical protein
LEPWPTPSVASGADSNESLLVYGRRVGAGTGVIYEIDDAALVVRVVRIDHGADIYADLVDRPLSGTPCDKMVS